MSDNLKKTETLKKSDYGKAVKFAEKGMHFDWYLDSRAGIFLYGRYFLNKGLCEATDVIAAYADGRLAGVLIASTDGGGEKCFATPLRRAYVRFFEWCQRMFFSGFDSYGEANAEMLEDFKKHDRADGEIYLLAVDPEMYGSGIGTLLLDELSRRYSGKNFYLFTDSGCNYGYYPHKSFLTSGEKEITLTVHGRDIKLKCFLYTKSFT